MFSIFRLALRIVDLDRHSIGWDEFVRLAEMLEVLRDVGLTVVVFLAKTLEENQSSRPFVQLADKLRGFFEVSECVRLEIKTELGARGVHRMWWKHERRR